MFNLFGRRRHEPKTKDPIPPWMKWATLLFIIYAVATSPARREETRVEAPTSPPATTQTSPTVTATPSVKAAAEYKAKLIPNVALRVEDVVAPDKALPTICGQEVSIAYAAFAGDQPLDDIASKENPLRFRIGEGKVMPAIDQGVLGMGTGGVRDIITRYDLSYGSPGYERKDVSSEAIIRFRVKLLDASPDLTKLQAAPFRITEVLNGQGTLVVCGKPVEVVLTVWDTKGKQLFSSEKPLTFTPGKSGVFLALEQGVIGMRSGGLRTLIVPPPFQRTLYGEESFLDIPFPKAETVIMDVEVK